MLPEEFAKNMDPNVVVPGEDPEGKARAEVYLLSTLWKLQLDMMHWLDELRDRTGDRTGDEAKDEGETWLDAGARERLRGVMIEGVEEVAKTVKRLTRSYEPLMPHVKRVNLYEVAEQCGYDQEPDEQLKGLGEEDYAELDRVVCKEFRRRYGREPEVASVIVRGKEVKAHVFLETEREFIVEWLDEWEEGAK